MLAHIAEVDARKLYVAAGYASMYRYCVGRLKMSEDVARKRIQAARAARQFPAIFAAVADGRLHLTAVVKLALHPGVGRGAVGGCRQQDPGRDRMLARRALPAA